MVLCEHYDAIFSRNWKLQNKWQEKSGTYLLKVKDTWLHPGHVNTLFHFIDVTFDQPQAEGFHHKQLHLMDRQRYSGISQNQITLAKIQFLPSNGVVE